MKERFGARNPKSIMLRFPHPDCRFDVNRQQPIHVVRVPCKRWLPFWRHRSPCTPTEATEALGLPTEDAARWRCETQQIIATKTGVPALPTYWRQLPYRKAHDEIEQGAATISTASTPWRTSPPSRRFHTGEIQNAAYEFQQSVERGENNRASVLNKFRQAEEHPTITFQWIPQWSAPK